MKIYFFENNKLKYFCIGDDSYSIDYEKKLIYMTKEGQCFAPISFIKLKIKKDKLMIYCKEIKIDFGYRWGV